MSEHTKGPWDVEICGDAAHNNVKVYIDAASPELNDGVYIAFVLGPDKEKNARRIVACVNACAGLDTELLEALGDTQLSAVYDRLRGQRDKALEFLKKALDAMSTNDDEGLFEHVQSVMDMRAFIAEVEASK